METISLISLLEADETGGEEVYSYLSSFSCEVNPDVESYLHEKAIGSEKRGSTRTVLVIDEEQNNAIIGYFTITTKSFEFKDVSGTIKKRLTGDKNAVSFITVLIAQLGRSDSYKGKIGGSEILELALDRCSLINELSAIKIACVEHASNIKLVKFYEDNKFKVIQNNDNGYTMSYIRL